MIKSYEVMVDLINKGERESNPSPLDIEDLFVSGRSLKIIDQVYYGEANGLGTKTLEELKKKTTKIKYNKNEIQRGRKKSDYSFTTCNDSYTFEHNNLILEVNTFSPRSRNKIIFNLKCN